MSISLKTVFLLSILIINVHQLESFKLLHTRNEPVSPCCRPSFLTNLFSYSPCACPPPTTTLPPKVKPPKPVEFHFYKCELAKCNVNPVEQAADLEKISKELVSLFSSGIQQMALKPIGILAGGSNLALGTMLHIGGGTFKLIGTLIKSGGEFAETAGYDLKTTGALKVVNGMTSIASFLRKLGSPPSVICIVNENKLDFYEPVDEKKEAKVEKVEKYPVTTESYKPITYKPVEYTPPVTTPYSSPPVKYTPITTKATTTTSESAYDSGLSSDVYHDNDNDSDNDQTTMQVGGHLLNNQDLDDRE